MKTIPCALVLAATFLHAASFQVASIKPASPDEVGISGEDGRNGLLKTWNVGSGMTSWPKPITRPAYSNF
jgi:hypothetical protein